LVKEKFVAVAVPTWVCRSKTPEGEFLRAVGIDKQWVTSSGYFTCITAGGKFLGHFPSAEVLKTFNSLPKEVRAPGVPRLPDLKPEERTVASPPSGGLVLRVHARFLSKDDKGKLRYARGEDFPLMGKTEKQRNYWALFLHPNTEYMWITEAEWKAHVPAKPTKGEKIEVAPAIIDRLARFHLTPRRAMTSEGGILAKKDVKAAKLTLTVEEVTPKRIRMSLAGLVHTGTKFDTKQATTPNGPLGFGFEAPLQGVLEYDREKKAFVRFDIVALGSVWGRWGDANGKSLFAERPGRTPFGFALELADMRSPTDRIPPGGNSAYVNGRSGYFAPSK
jgi:hypothetical protein